MGLRQWPCSLESSTSPGALHMGPDMPKVWLLTILTELLTPYSSNMFYPMAIKFSERESAFNHHYRLIPLGIDDGDAVMPTLIGRPYVATLVRVPTLESWTHKTRRVTGKITLAYQGAWFWLLIEFPMPKLLHCPLVIQHSDGKSPFFHRPTIELDDLDGPWNPWLWFFVSIWPTDK